MKIVKEGNIEHLKNHMCKVCLTVFNLSASDLIFETRQVNKEKITEHFYTWFCGLCEAQNRLVVLSQNGAVWTKDGWKEDWDGRFYYD